MILGEPSFSGHGKTIVSSGVGVNGFGKTADFRKKSILANLGLEG
jgi:hypothetical protein